jgi:phospholipid/cholesterol/gamma-HCH transport system ATP-binding protein
MSEEKDQATIELERAHVEGEDEGLPPIVPQLRPSPGLPPRLAVERRRERVMGLLPHLPYAAQQAILASIGGRR